MDWPFQPFDPERRGRRRFRTVPIRSLIPNVITLLAISMGLTAIRMAIEGRFEWAIAAIAAAAILDMLDGRVARLLKATSRFGAELDSLADFVNFGVSPAVILYSWSLLQLKSVGWIGVLAFAICCVLRLARFNVALDEDKPAWQSNYFVGMPAPAGALSLLLPLYLYELGATGIRDYPVPVLVYCVLVAFMMVSRIPTFSGKSIGGRVSLDLVVPLFFFFVLAAAFLISFPWFTLGLATIAYLCSIPISFVLFHRQQKAELAKTGKVKTKEASGTRRRQSGKAADKDQQPEAEPSSSDQPTQLH
jgi:CDP-diacylglycerol---serine O-phosphatidyltransferase